MGFPICAIDHKGEGIMSKEKNTGGCMTVNSVTSQLLYEIQGPLYYNCDVTANLEGIKIEQPGEGHVKVSGVKGLPPPPTTTKVGITGFAGWQDEYHIYLVGLHMEEKCRWIEEQIRYEFGPKMIKKFDVRQAEGKPYYEYHPSLLPQSAVQQRVHCMWGGHEDKGFRDGKKVIDIPLAPEFQEYDRQQLSYETTNPVSLTPFGPTVRLPLGSIVLGRSGDKCSDANVGFFVRHDDEWEWLRSLLTVDKIEELLGPEEYKGKPIDRFEMPNIRAVHFLMHDHLDRGYDACSTCDTLGKNVCEYLRAKTVDVPVRFVERGVL